MRKPRKILTIVKLWTLPVTMTAGMVEALCINSYVSEVAPDNLRTIALVGASLCLLWAAFLWWTYQLYKNGEFHD